MIARSWHGAVPQAKGEAYHRYLLISFWESIGIDFS